MDVYGREHGAVACSFAVPDVDVRIALNEECASDLRRMAHAADQPRVIKDVYDGASGIRETQPGLAVLLAHYAPSRGILAGVYEGIHGQAGNVGKVMVYSSHEDEHATGKSFAHPNVCVRS